MISLINRNGFYVRISSDRPISLTEHLDIIMSKISEAGGEIKLICSKSREQEHKTWRQIAMWYARYNQLGTWKAIGIYFNRDHSTVINAVNYINDLIESNDSEVIIKLEKIGVNHNKKTILSKPYIYTNEM